MQKIAAVSHGIFGEVACRILKNFPQKAAPQIGWFSSDTARSVNLLTYLINLWCCWWCQLIPMTDIKEMTPEFQKLNKTDNCIVIYLKNDARVAVTSQVINIDTLTLVTENGVCQPSTEPSQYTALLYSETVLSRIAAVDWTSWDVTTWVFPVSLPHSG